MTFAPQSASWRTAVGPALCAVRSRTEKRFRGSVLTRGRGSEASWPNPPLLVVRVGIAGVGTIGSEVIRLLGRGEFDARVVAVSARDEARARARLPGAVDGIEFVGLDTLPEMCDLVVEAMPSAMFAAIAEPTIACG